MDSDNDETDSGAVKEAEEDDGDEVSKGEVEQADGGMCYEEF